MMYIIQNATNDKMKINNDDSKKLKNKFKNPVINKTKKTKNKKNFW